jgi:hypothetical protein
MGKSFIYRQLFPSFLILHNPYTIEQMIRHFSHLNMYENIVTSLIVPKGKTSKESSTVLMMASINHFVVP